MYVIPPEQSAEFVSNMEDVLEIYHLPYDPKCPVICMDKQPQTAIIFFMEFSYTSPLFPVPKNY